VTGNGRAVLLDICTGLVNASNELRWQSFHSLTSLTTACYSVLIVDIGLKSVKENVEVYYVIDLLGLYIMLMVVSQCFGSLNAGTLSLGYACSHWCTCASPRKKEA